MYYHASPIPNLKRLIPHVSNHGTPLVYLSSPQSPPDYLTFFRAKFPFLSR